jgi:peptidoglycan/LPS O-acetylase OafA/YrhL
VLISFSVLGAGTSITLGKLAPLGIWLGTLGAFLLRNARTFNLLSKTLGLELGPPVLAVTTLWVLETSVGGQAGFVICALAFLSSCLISADALTKRVLSQRLLMHIGKVSYGIYLLHMICKALVLKTLAGLNVNASNITVFLLVLGSSTILATLSYLTFERFFLNFKSRFAR